MQTIILEKPEHFVFTETSIPDEIPDGHALVAVRRIGICGTDLHAYRGHQPFFSYPSCLLYTSPSPRDGLLSRMPSSA